MAFNLITLVVSLVILILIYKQRQVMMMKPNSFIFMTILYAIAFVLFLDGIGVISILDILGI
jgi:hypothetical protein